MNKVAFVIPLHPKHYTLANTFMQSFMLCNINKQADLCFVFSSEEDSKSFDVFANRNNGIKNVAMGGGG
ncbi:hypothetical protein [Helicobacter bilis]|nr:hypothetical protein [Helicobacter bilis]